MQIKFLLKIAIVTLVLGFQTSLSAQVKLCKDLDKDGLTDTVYIDSAKSSIVCRLSTQKFKKNYSKPIDILNFQSGVRSTKNGFEFYNDWMRAGYKNQFRYNTKTKKMQLIGMSLYEFGNAVHDGAGESSVNLLTSDYIGNWSYFDIATDKVIKLPTIKTKMRFKTINLEQFSEDTYFGYADKCAALFHQYKALHNKKPKK